MGLSRGLSRDGYLQGAVFPSASCILNVVKFNSWLYGQSRRYCTQPLARFLFRVLSVKENEYPEGGRRESEVQVVLEI